MKRVTILVAVVCLLAATVVSAQENPHKGDMPQMTITMLYEETVHPAHMQAYEEGTRKWMQAIRDAGIDLTIYAHQNYDVYGYMVVMSDFSQMNMMAMKFSQAVDLLRGSEWGEARQKAVKHSKYTIWMHEPELSWWPEGQPGPSPATPMISIFSFTTSHSKEMDLRATLKEWQEWENIDEWSNGYQVHRNIIGEKGPMYIVVSFAESASSYFARGEKVREKYGDEMRKMQYKMGKSMTSMDQDYLWMRPDLSLVTMEAMSGSAEGNN